jgi:uncharacterized alkaline shock family protein YloU
MEEIKELVLSEIKEIAGIDAGILLDIGLIPEDHARKWVLKRKYFEMAKTGRTYTDIKLELSVEYGVSISTIERIVYKR